MAEMNKPRLHKAGITDILQVCSLQDYAQRSIVAAGTGTSARTGSSSIAACAGTSLATLAVQLACV
jgi:hypothetical protein